MLLKVRKVEKIGGKNDFFEKSFIRGKNSYIRVCLNELDFIAQEKALVSTCEQIAPITSSSPKMRWLKNYLTTLSFSITIF